MIHAIPTKTTISAAGTAELFYLLHIMSGRSFNKILGTSLKMSTDYHPQTDGLTKKENWTAEQMLLSMQLC